MVVQRRDDQASLRYATNRSPADMMAARWACVFGSILHWSTPEILVKANNEGIWYVSHGGDPQSAVWSVPTKNSTRASCMCIGHKSAGEWKNATLPKIARSACVHQGCLAWSRAPDPRARWSGGGRADHGEVFQHWNAT